LRDNRRYKWRRNDVDKCIKNLKVSREMGGTPASPHAARKRQGRL